MSGASIVIPLIFDGQAHTVKQYPVEQFGVCGQVLKSGVENKLAGDAEAGKGILANNPDRGHGDFDTGAAVVGVHHHHVRGDLVAADDVAVGHTGQHPNLAATLQGPGSLVSHASTQQVIGELESILVLHHLVAVRHDTQRDIIGTAGVDLVASNQGAILSVDILLDDLPIQASVDQSVSRSRGLLDLGSQTVPGLFSDIEHGFNISGHSLYLLHKFTALEP